MSLRKAPTRTPTMPAVNRTDAQKSSGPRAPGGKGRVRLNGLNLGRAWVRCPSCWLSG